MIDFAMSPEFLYFVEHSVPLAHVRFAMDRGSLVLVAQSGEEQMSLPLKEEDLNDCVDDEGNKVVCPEIEESGEEES